VSGRLAAGPSVAVPLLANSRGLGALVLGRHEGPRFPDGAVPLLAALGVQLGVSVENARLFSDVRRRLSDLEAVHALALRIFGNTPGDVRALLDDGCREVTSALGGRGSAVYLAEPTGASLRLAAGCGGPFAGARETLALQTGLAAEAFRRRTPVWTENVAAEPPGSARAEPGLPPFAILAVPLTSRVATRGVLFVADDPGRRFTDPDLALANALAGELAVGVENAELYADSARLYEDLRRSYAELARAQRQLIQQERLAALGELSAVVAHEVRNPLGVIFNSLGSLRRLLKPTGDACMLLDIVGEEADRLNRIVGDLLDFARPSTPEFRPEPLSRVVDDALAAALAQNPSGVRLVREADDELPLVPLDARLVRQAILNVAVNAVQAMPRGGRLRVRVRRDGDAALLELQDSGAGISEEVRHRMFEPFFTTKASGTGLGLAVVKRIVDGHGGEITVTSPPGGGTVFTVRFPLSPAGFGVSGGVLG
jgi:signal transduction histidine kinase